MNDDDETLEDTTAPLLMQCVVVTKVRKIRQPSIRRQYHTSLRKASQTKRPKEKFVQVIQYCNQNSFIYKLQKDFNMRYQLNVFITRGVSTGEIIASTIMLDCYSFDLMLEYCRLCQVRPGHVIFTKHELATHGSCLIMQPLTHTCTHIHKHTRRQKHLLTHTHNQT